MQTEIPNSDLKEKDIPSPGADWHVIETFALTFNGYNHCGSFEKCGEIANSCFDTYKANKTLTNSLDELRSCLFFEQRRWRHFAEDPDESTMIYIHALVEKIREQVRLKEG